MKFFSKGFQIRLLATFACAASVLLMGVLPVRADMFTPSPVCSKPIKPFSFDSQWEVESFYMEVERYKRCIEGFVEEQNEASRKHQEAADEAIGEWNNFVRWELN